MPHDEKYYERLHAIWRFVFNSLYLVMAVIMITISVTQAITQSKIPFIYSSVRTVLACVMMSLFVVIIRVPFLIEKLRKIDLDNGIVNSPAKSNKDLVKYLSHAREKGLIDENNRLLKPRAEFVRFCIDYMYFYPYKRSDWRVLENILKDGEGNPISAAKLAQTFQDIQTREGI